MFGWPSWPARRDRRKRSGRRCHRVDRDTEMRKFRFALEPVLKLAVRRDLEARIRIAALTSNLAGLRNRDHLLEAASAHAEREAGLGGPHSRMAGAYHATLARERQGVTHAISRTTALLGETDSDFTDGQQRIDDIDVQEGSNLLALNMPIDPNGVVYDSISRAPVAGAVVSLLDPRNSLPVPDTCFDDPNQQDQVTIGNGYYKFDINFSSGACPGPGNYLVQVTAPSDVFVPGTSQRTSPDSSGGP